MNAPGVYIREINKLPPTVVQPETAVPVFVGVTPRASATSPVRISSMLDYENLFGSAAFVINLKTTSGNNPVTTVDSVSDLGLYRSLQLYFANGGGACYILSAGTYAEKISKAKYEAALLSLRRIDEPTLLVFPDLAGLSSSEYYDVCDAALTHAAEMQDRFVVIDVATHDGAAANPVSYFRSEIGTANLSYGAAYYPNLLVSVSPVVADSQVLIVQTSGTANNPVYAAHTFASAGALGATTDADMRAALAGYLAGKNNILTLPPSGAVAGIIARTDRTRGVWKAPANESVTGVLGADRNFTQNDLETLNIDSVAGKSINAIKFITGKGLLLFGARTLAGNDNEWRYVSVRRFFITTEEAVKNTCKRYVFDSNDGNTWVNIKAAISGYLMGVWRAGALQGALPQDAFFVSCGLGETMTAQDILDGKLIVKIGLAAVRPAEFIVIEFSQMQAS